jgi:hypothetical protein
MIMIGRMAEKWGQLPSYVEQHATTYDLMIMDVLSVYDNYQQQKASGKVDPSVYQFTDEELKTMLEKSRGK